MAWGRAWPSPGPPGCRCPTGASISHAMASEGSLLAQGRTKPSPEPADCRCLAASRRALVGLRWERGEDSARGNSPALTQTPGLPRRGSGFDEGPHSGRAGRSDVAGSEDGQALLRTPGLPRRDGFPTDVPLLGCGESGREKPGGQALMPIVRTNALFTRGETAALPRRPASRWAKVTHASRHRPLQRTVMGRKPSRLVLPGPPACRSATASRRMPPLVSRPPGRSLRGRVSNGYPRLQAIALGEDDPDALGAGCGGRLLTGASPRQTTVEIVALSFASR